MSKTSARFEPLALVQIASLLIKFESRSIRAPYKVLHMLHPYFDARFEEWLDE